MRGRAALLVILLLGVATSCKSKSSATTTSSDADVRPAPKTFAEACELEKDRTLAAWASSDLKPLPDGGALMSCGPSAVWLGCVADDNATSGWLVTSNAVTLTIDVTKHAPRCEFSWQLVHLDVASGVRDAMTVGRRTSMDGDGAPQRLTAIGNGGVLLDTFRPRINPFTTPPAAGQVFTVKNGKIMRFPGLESFTVTAMADVDHDGILDFDLTSPFRFVHELPTTPAHEFYEEEGPPLVAHHYADGHVALDDAVAIGEARKSCDKRPSKKPPTHGDTKPDRGGTKEETLPLVFAGIGEWIACSRLWGVASADIKQALPTVCRSFVDTKAFDVDADAEEKILAGVCPTYLLAWADLEVPLLIEH